MRRNPTQHSFTAILAFFLFLTGAGAPLHAQWQPNGLVLLDVIGKYQLLPTEDGGHWVVYDTPLGPQFYCGHVQRYDADGYPQLPGHGQSPYTFPAMSIINPFGHNSEITGAVLCDSGNIIVGFESTTLAPDSGSCMYAQKISPEGELLWGDSGVVALEEGAFQSPQSFFPSITSDGSGGIWGFYRHLPGQDMYLYGVNGDGSQKLTEPVQLREDGDGLHDPVLLRAHPDGGVYAVYEDWINEDQRGLFIQRFSAEGEPVWQNHVLVMNRLWYERRDIELLPDNSVVILNGRLGHANLFLNRISEDGEVLWEPFMDLSGPYSGGGVTELVLLPDTTLVFLRAWVAGMEYENRIYRLTAEGTPYYDEGWYCVYDAPIRSTHPDMGITVSQNPEYAFSLCPVIMPGMNQADRNILIQFLNLDSGIDGFHPDTILVSNDLYVHWYVNKGIITNDNAYIIAAKNPTNYSALHQFKVLSDGTVVGLDNAVAESAVTPPLSFSVSGIYPNPFNSTISVALDLPIARTVEMKVVTIEGRLVERQSYPLAAGRQQLVWQAPQGLASGVLFFTFDDGVSSITRKVIFEK